MIVKYDRLDLPTELNQAITDWLWSQHPAGENPVEMSWEIKATFEPFDEQWWEKTIERLRNKDDGK